eukprot:SAG11_NODE_36071_length_263_cov_1.024390_1_plen_39_part_10
MQRVRRVRAVLGLGQDDCGGGGAQPARLAKLPVQRLDER